MKRPPLALPVGAVLLLAAASTAGAATGATPADQVAGSGGPTTTATGLATPGATNAGGEPGAPQTPGERCLVVENATSGERLLTRPVANGTPVVLTYTHSVERTRVVDAYAVRGDRLVMVRMEFASYGAGLPAGAAVNRTGDGAFVFDPAGAYHELYVQPGRVAGHVLRVGNAAVDLVALSDANGVRLHVAPATSTTGPGGSCPLHAGEEAPP